MNVVLVKNGARCPHKRKQEPLNTCQNISSTVTQLHINKMKPLFMSRREFLKTSALAAMASTSPGNLPAQEKKPGTGVNWPIGCFNRPWVKDEWNFDLALREIKSAGYKWTGLLTRAKDEPFLGPEAAQTYLAQLKQRIAKSGLKANMGSLRIKSDLPLKEQITDLHKQIDNAKFLDLEFVLTFGVDKPEHYATYYKLMADGAAYAEERGVKLVLKPHGGGSGAAEEIIRCMGRVKHPNFKIWYDAGNIIYYTGKDPLEQLKPIAQHVTGFCAKDCDKQKGEVMIQFGAGKVDFRTVFSELKKAGFNGPVMVECCERTGKLEEVTANARANREFLEKLFASL